MRVVGVAWRYAVPVAVVGLALFAVSPLAGVVALLVSGGVLFALRGFILMTRQAGQNQTRVMKALLARLTESLPGITPVKAMAREKNVNHSMDELTALGAKGIIITDLRTCRS